jgi:molybdopterin/thiamine biosynthesis adenylyltransferase
MYNYNNRFKDAPWYEKSLKENILVIGCGGIGSNALYCLTKTIPANYWIVDEDIVVEHNIGTQFFTKNQVDKYKVEAISETISNYADVHLVSFKKKFSNEHFPITITALDNMKARKEVYELWKSKEDRELLLDGRLRANLYEVYVVTPGREAEYEKTLFEDKEVDEGLCTFKQTAYFGMLIGARITHCVVNYLINKYTKEEICNLPFKVQEIGEPFYFETK